jgi:hypothetical protein
MSSNRRRTTVQRAMNQFSSAEELDNFPYLNQHIYDLEENFLMREHSKKDQIHSLGLLSVETICRTVRTTIRTRPTIHGNSRPTV